MCTPKLFLQKMAPQASSGQQMFFLSSVVPAKARLGHALPGKKVCLKKRGALHVDSLMRQSMAQLGWASEPKSLLAPNQNMKCPGSC